MELFGNTHFEELRDVLGVRPIPSHDTIQRVISMISPDLLRRIYTLWCRGMGFELETAASLKRLQLLNIDGKTVRVSGGRGRKAVHIESLRDLQQGVCVSQTAAEKKGSEITAIPVVLEGVDLTGAVVTLDAMGTQTATVKPIREQGRDCAVAA